MSLLGGSKSSSNSSVTVIGTNITFEGNISGQDGVVDVHGTINGTITAGVVIIREGAVVNGTMNVGNVTIHGHFEGEIQAKEVSLTPTGVVYGKVRYTDLNVEKGGQMLGEFIPEKQIKAPQPKPQQLGNEELGSYPASNQQKDAISNAKIVDKKVTKF